MVRYKKECLNTVYKNSSQYKYLNQANGQMCLLVQAETEGVDGVFFGPADLSASMGHRGQPGHPEVQKGHPRRHRHRARRGILATDPALAQQYLDAGALFVAMGVDTTLLVKAASGLVQRFGGGLQRGQLRRRAGIEALRFIRSRLRSAEGLERSVEFDE